MKSMIKMNGKIFWWKPDYKFFPDMLCNESLLQQNYCNATERILYKKFCETVASATVFGT